MAVSTQDLLDCASLLTRDTGGTEARARAAVSRTYYAAYHNCVEWHDALPAQGTVPVDFAERGVHVEFAARLQNPDKTLSVEEQFASRSRGVALRQLHGDRVNADYRLKKTITPQDARTSLAKAKRIILM